MMKILLATNNPGKQREINALLAGLPIELVLPRHIGIELEVNETGETYAENASLKAVAFANRSGLFTLSDDSGLEVEALGGLPGVHSARFSPLPGASDADRRRLLVERLAGFPHPWTARFVCVAAVAAPGVGGAPVEIRFFEGICPGEIIDEERGSDGFGYDPIFLLSHLGRTMAQLSLDEKNRLSHRALALQAARPWLVELLG